MDSSKILEVKKCYLGDEIPDKVKLNRKDRAFLESRLPGEFIGYYITDSTGTVETFIALPSLKKYHLI